MDITYLGHSSFRIKGKTATVVTDPFSTAMVGFKFPKTEADIVTVSHQHEDHQNTLAVEGNPFLISLPGEYEVKGVSIFGFPSFHDNHSGSERGGNIIYLVEADGLRICHLGDLGDGVPQKTLAEIIGVDVLFVPVGGVATIGPEEAVEVVNKIEPLLVIPMHFKALGINEQVFGKFAPVEKFLAQMGAEGAERLDKLSVSKDKLPQETKVVVLERKG